MLFMLTIFKVDGGWSDWVSGSCSATCGGGTETQTRTCDNPTPLGSGADCAGLATQSVSCNTQACPGLLELKISSGSSDGYRK